MTLPRWRKARRPFRGGPAKRGLAVERLEDRLAPAGTWAALANTPPGSNGIGEMMLLPNGVVMAQEGEDSGKSNISSTWYQLDAFNGSNYQVDYQFGQWSRLPSMGLQRRFFASNVLTDNRVLVLGGEFSNDPTVSKGNDTPTGEIFNPLAGPNGTWMPIQNFNVEQSLFGDDPTEVLSDGTVLAGYINGPQTYLYDPSTNSWSASGGKLRGDRSDEESWVKLADGSILSYDVFASFTSGIPSAQRYIPAGGKLPIGGTSTGQWVPAGKLPFLLSTPGVGYELGPGLLLPDGRALFLGGNGNTAYYTPSTNSWTAGQPIPGGLVAADAPAAMLPNGDVLLAASPPGTAKPNGSGYTFPNGTRIFELNATTNPANWVYQDVTPGSKIASGFDLSKVNSFATTMLLLPSGQVLLADQNNNHVLIYTPTPGPQEAWKPTITGLTYNGTTLTNGNYILTGTQFNGLSEGSAYGDDAEMASNFPIVLFGDPIHNTIANAWTFERTGTGVQTGNTPESADVILPDPIAPLSVSYMTVIANGIMAEPVLLIRMMNAIKLNDLTLRLDPTDSSKLQIEGASGTQIAEVSRVWMGATSRVVVTGYALTESLTVDFSNGPFEVTFDSDPNGGKDSLTVAGDPATIWEITGSGRGTTANGLISFDGMLNLYAESKITDFVFQPGGTISGVVAAGYGVGSSDTQGTLDLSALPAAAVTFDDPFLDDPYPGFGGKATFTFRAISFLGITAIFGNPGTRNSLASNDPDPLTWQVQSQHSTVEDDLAKRTLDFESFPLLTTGTGQGANSVTVEGTTENLQNDTEGLSIAGNGQTSLVLDDQNDPSGQPYQVSPSEVLVGPFGLGYSGVNQLTLNGTNVGISSANNIATVTPNPAAPGAYVIIDDTQKRKFSKVVIDDHNGTAPTGSSGSVYEATRLMGILSRNLLVDQTQVSKGSAWTVSHAGPGTVELEGDNLQDTYYVSGTTPGTVLNLDTGEGVNGVFVTPFSQQVQNLGGNVFVTGGTSGSTTVTIEDQKYVNQPPHAVVQTYTIMPDGTTAGDPVTIGYANVQAVVLDGAPSGAYNLEGVPSGTSYTINPGSGSNTLSATPAALPLLAGGNGFTLTSAGPIALTIDDGGDTQNTTYNITASTVQIGNLPVFTYSGYSSLTVVGAGRQDVFNVLQTAVPVTIVAGNLFHGVNSTTVNVGNGNLDAIQGPLAIDGFLEPTGLDLLDQSSTAALAYTLTATSVTRSGAAAIDFSNLASVSIAAGSGDDSLSVSAAPTIPVAFMGGSGNNSVIGPNVPNSWNIAGTNTGTLGKLAFLSVQNLTGGSAADTFAFGLQGQITGNLDGGGGDDTLDESLVPGNVLVDLPLGVATGVGGTVNTIANVLGGAGTSILVGTAGTATLTAGAGRSLLIAGPNPALLIGGGGDDILVGGQTSYDTDVVSLNALMAEWSSGQPYTNRVSHLLAGGGLNGSTLLNGSTFQPNGGGNTLTGGGGLDLFYGSLSLDSSDWNAAQGEVFVEPDQIHGGSTQVVIGQLSIPGLLLDGSQVLAALSSQGLPLIAGSHTLTDPASGASVTFGVNAGGVVSYDPSLQGVLSGAGTTTLMVNGVRLAIDARSLSVARLSLDGASVATISPIGGGFGGGFGGIGSTPSGLLITNRTVATFTGLPGTLTLTDVNDPQAQVQFTLHPDGTVSFDLSLAGVLAVQGHTQDTVGGNGTSTLLVKGRRILVNASALSVPRLGLDGVAILTHPVGPETTGVPSFTALPGVYRLADSANSAAAVNFTILRDGTIGYDGSLQGVLSGTGSSTLSVLGRTLTIDARALSVSSLLLDGFSSVTNTATATITDLPGTLTLGDVNPQGSQVQFTLNPDGTVSYDLSLNGVLSGMGTSTLTVLGRTITVDARALSLTSMALDGVSVSDTATTTFTGLPGPYFLANNASEGTGISFTLLPDGTVSYDSSLQGLLSGAGTTTLTVQGVSLTIDATALAGQAATFSVAGLSGLSTAQVQTLQLLPGSLGTQAGTLDVGFTLTSQDRLAYDASFDAVITGRGSNKLTLLPPA